jgi:UDP-N-acetyl-D-galactosamine dehydrogenase
MSTLPEIKIIVAAHHQFKTMGATAIRALGKPVFVLYDLRYLLPGTDSDLYL